MRSIDEVGLIVDDSDVLAVGGDQVLVMGTWSLALGSVWLVVYLVWTSNLGFLGWWNFCR